MMKRSTIVLVSASLFLAMWLAACSDSPTGGDQAAVSEPPGGVNDGDPIAILVDMTDCNQVARKILGITSERQIASFLRSTAREVLPEVY